MAIASSTVGFTPVANTVGTSVFVQSEMSTTSLRADAAADSDGSSSATAISTKQVLTDEDVINVASFRNELTNPKMMVENAKKKLSGVDNTAAALDGLKVGLVYLGLPLFAYDYYDGGDLAHALQFYGM